MVGVVGFAAAVLGDNIGFAVGHYGGRAPVLAAVRRDAAADPRGLIAVMDSAADTQHSLCHRRAPEPAAGPLTTAAIPS